MTLNLEAEELSAIDIVKQHPKTIEMLKKHSSKDYKISYGEVELGGQCGIVGCTWQKLVSMVITADRANMPTLTILAVVSGNIPHRGSAPNVRFVELKDMDPAIWQTQL